MTMIYIIVNRQSRFSTSPASIPFSYAVVAKISCAIDDNVRVVSFIDSALR